MNCAKILCTLCRGLATEGAEDEQVRPVHVREHASLGSYSGSLEGDGDRGHARTFAPVAFRHACDPPGVHPCRGVPKGQTKGLG
jgi:hypothetical protein